MQEKEENKSEEVRGRGTHLIRYYNNGGPTRLEYIQYVAEQARVRVEGRICFKGNIAAVWFRSNVCATIKGKRIEGGTKREEKIRVGKEWQQRREDGARGYVWSSTIDSTDHS